jgi:hypothetical protein
MAVQLSMEPHLMSSEMLGMQRSVVTPGLRRTAARRPTRLATLLPVAMEASRMAGRLRTAARVETAALETTDVVVQSMRMQARLRTWSRPPPRGIRELAWS